MDITTLFKACVKTVRTRNKALGIGDKIQIIRSTKTKSEFAKRAKDILVTITKMKEFLLEHRKNYINTNHLLYGTSSMSDSERDKIDSDAQTFMQLCIDVIKTLNADTKKCLESQVKQHQEGVIFLIDCYLKAVCKIYTGQKAIRVKQAVDKQKMLRLDSEIKPKKNPVFGSENSVDGESGLNKSLPKKEPTVNFGEPMDVEPTDLSLSPEELQMFEEENQRLYEEMNTLADEVRVIEGRVVEVGKLQEILSEKVLQQDQMISNISDTVVHSTENIKEGNEDIRDAIRKKAGFRVWILFFLLVLSFSLLFLDWYSP